MGDISLAVERAEQKTETLRAKAGAIDELAAAGVLDDPISGSEDDLTRQLQQVTATASVDSELEALKAGLGAVEQKSLQEGKA